MKIFSIIAFAFIFLTVSCPVLAQENICECKAAAESDVPLGDNMPITFSVGKVKQIKGTAAFPDKPEGAIIEVFEVGEKEAQKINNENAPKIAENKSRKVACLAAKDGKFCFKDLSKGLYVLRIGTNSRGAGQVFVIVELDPKNGKDKNIKVGVQVAN